MNTSRIPEKFHKQVNMIENGFKGAKITEKTIKYRILEKMIKKGAGKGEYTVGFCFKVGNGAKEKTFKTKMGAAAQLLSWFYELGHSPVEFY